MHHLQRHAHGRTIQNASLNVRHIHMFSYNKPDRPLYRSPLIVSVCIHVLIHPSPLCCAEVMCFPQSSQLFSTVSLTRFVYSFRLSL